MNDVDPGFGLYVKNTYTRIGAGGREKTKGDKHTGVLL
jgi:hypothetical protein